MAAVTWYETIEGKLAMAFALLLVILTVVIAQPKAPSANPSSSPQIVTTTNRPIEPPRTVYIAELPPLTPFDIPPDTSNEKPASATTARTETTKPASEPLKPENKTDHHKPNPDKRSKKPPQRPRSLLNLWLR